MNSPPRVGVRILERLLPAGEGDELLGDLHERFLEVCQAQGRAAGRRWYWRQVIVAVPRVWAARRGGLSRDPRGAPRLASLGAALSGEVRYALRIVRREPGFSLTVVSILGLGIGATTTMFSIGKGILGNLPTSEPDEVVAVRWLDPRGGSEERMIAAEVAALGRSHEVFESLAAYRSVDVQIADPEARPDRRNGAFVSPQLFAMLGTEPLLGRLFVDDDTRSGAPPALLIGEGIWSDRYGSAPDVVGRVVRVNEVQRTIVGVLPASFGFPKNQEAWLPLPRGVEEAAVGVEVVGRLRQGVTLDAARTQVRAVGERLTLERGVQPEGRALDVLPFVELYVGRSDRMMMLTMVVAVGFVLLIASANVANLLLSRAILRSREVALRRAIGCGRMRIVVHGLIETLILSALGGLVGLALTGVGVAWFRHTMGDVVLLWWMAFGVDRSTFLWATGCVVAATLAAGLAPAIQASGVDLQRAIKSESAGSTDARRPKVGKVLSAAQLSLSCALLILSMLMVRGVTAKSLARPSFAPESVMTGTILLGAYDYPDAVARRRFYMALEERLSALEGTRDVSFTSDLPSLPGTITRIARKGGGTDDPGVRTAVRWVSPSFFDLFRMNVVGGRLFDSRDEASGLVVGVANQALADALGGADEGTPLVWAGTNRSRPEPVVVGVVADLDVSMLDGNRMPGLFLPDWDMPYGEMRVAIRSDTPRDGDLAAAMFAAVAGLDPNLPLRDVTWLDRALADRMIPERAFATLFSLFGLAATLLASVGLYGVVAFNVNRRVREFGIRRALGASPGALRSQAASEGMPALVLGLGGGAFLGFVLAPGLGGGLSGADPHDPLTYAGVLALLTGVCALAILLPGSRAASIEPMDALRSE